MCGLFGYITPSPKVETSKFKSFFNQALIVDSLRGEDSTGVLLVNEDDSVFSYKKALAGYDFKWLSKYCTTLFKASPRVAMGHNRWASMGAVTHATAHPFKYGHINLSHNGTLSNHRMLDKENNSKTDSDFLAYSFSTIGVLETLKVIRGSFAITWVDTDLGTFNIVRNSERELYTCKTTNHSLLYASEKGLLSWITERNKITVTAPELLPEKEWHQINIKTGAIDVIKVEFIAPYSSNQSYGGYGYNDYSKGNKNYKVNTKLSSSGKALERIGIEVDETIYINYDKKIINNASMFSLCEWYSPPKDIIILIKDYVTKKDYIRENANEMFSATVVGCSHRQDSKDYHVYVKDIQANVIMDDVSTGKDLPIYIGPNDVPISRLEWEIMTRHGCDVCTASIDIELDKEIKWTRSMTPVCSECVNEYNKSPDTHVLRGMLL